jgi:hypothetical protein
VPTPHQLGFHRLELRSHPGAHRVPREQKLSRARSPADMREAQVRERFWFPYSTRTSISARKSAELDQTRFLGMQFECKLAKAFTKLREELLDIRAVFKPHDEVVGPSRDNHLAPRVPRPLFHHSCAQPFLDETQDPPIRDAMLDKFHQPLVVDGVKRILDTLPITTASTDTQST